MNSAMHKLRKLLPLFIITLITTSTAQATDGIFLSLDTGVAKQTELPPIEAVGATDLATNLTPALRAALGYNHDFFAHFGFGFEGALGRYGDSVYYFDDGGSNTIKSKTMEFLALFTTRVQKFDLIGKIGGVRQQTDITGENAPSVRRNCFELGAEVAYNFSPRFAVTAGYAHLFDGNPQGISDIPLLPPAIDEYLVGLRYTFAS